MNYVTRESKLRSVVRASTHPLAQETSRKSGVRSYDMPGLPVVLELNLYGTKASTSAWPLYFPCSVVDDIYLGQMNSPLLTIYDGSTHDYVQSCRTNLFFFRANAWANTYFRVIIYFVQKGSILGAFRNWFWFFSSKLFFMFLHAHRHYSNDRNCTFIF